MPFLVSGAQLWRSHVQDMDRAAERLVQDLESAAGSFTGPGLLPQVRRCQRKAPAPFFPFYSGTGTFVPESVWVAQSDPRARPLLDLCTNLDLS